MSLALRTAEVLPQMAGAPARVALIGTGTVGSAVLARLAAWQGTRLGERLQLVHVANSRAAIGDGKGLTLQSAHQVAASRAGGGDASRRSSAESAARATAALRDHLGDHGTRILIDATASDDIAARHAGWLTRGIHVVTACKLGQGGALPRWQEIRDATARGGVRYGDAATVGAGLPLLRTIRALRAGGDHIHALAGVLSGSLAWLFANYDGTRPFSDLVREARERGYTEPDPREDLSGEDVRRKLLILARTAGYAIDPLQVEVDSLVPDAVATLAREVALNSLESLDATMCMRYQQAKREGRRLHFVARFDERGGRVGLEALLPDEPLAQGGGCDNRVAIWSDRYSQRPLLIQGPGAGAEVTAAALLDDVLRIVGAGAHAH